MTYNKHQIAHRLAVVLAAIIVTSTTVCVARACPTKCQDVICKDWKGDHVGYAICWWACMAGKLLAKITAIGPAGGVIDLYASNEPPYPPYTFLLIRIDVPPGALSTSTDITVTAVKQPSTSVPAPWEVALMMYAFTPSSLTFSVPVTVTMNYYSLQYSSEYVGWHYSYDWQACRAASFELAESIWMPISTSVDLANHQVTFQTNHLKPFGLMGMGAPVGGIGAPVDKFELLAPYIGLASVILGATLTTGVCAGLVKRRRKKQ